MSFLRPNSRRNYTTRIFLGAVLLAAIIFALNFVTKGSVSRVARATLSPFASFERALKNKTDSFRLTFKSKKSLEAENEILRERLLSQEIIELNNLILKTENEDLRDIARVRPTAEADMHSVRVLSYVGAFPYGTLIIDNPGKQVEQGTFVYGKENVAIGTVLDAKGGTVSVHLLSAPGRTIDARIGEKLIPVELVGKGHGNFETSVPRGVAIIAGEHVALPQARGAIIGVVGNVESKDTDAFQTVRIRVPFPMQTLQFVRL